MDDGNRRKAAYYNHDKIWQKRSQDHHPVWGAHSKRLYYQALNLFESLGLLKGTLVDFGCGAGAFGTLCQERGFRYVGLDESQTAIDLDSVFSLA